MKPNGSMDEDSESCPVCGGDAGPDFPHCSVSCALAGRIPLSRDGLPVSWELAAFTMSGFLLFNQFLLWCLGRLKNERIEEMGADGFLTASIILGIIWGVSIGVAWVTHAPKRWGDYGIGLGASLILLLPEFDFFFQLTIDSRLLLFNLLISMRLYRGVYCLWRASKKREK